MDIEQRPAPDHSKITHCRISPGIGVARVGNSRDEYLIGPEVPYPIPVPEGGYKDAEGALKRQAARFRIYGYEATGKVVAELTADDAEIEWSVHVANKKASWYNFEVSMDVPDAVPVSRRNARFSGDARRKLEIDPGARSVRGTRTGRGGGAAPAFDTGTFLDEPVYLGELHTDEAGRLIFLGGRGRSGTPFPNNAAYTFANNDGWYDDVSDGPVSAIVRLGGKELPVTPAWVVVGPPNYAPGIVTPVTMYDVLFDLYQGWWDRREDTVSFVRHILPILRQFCDAQWVNFGFHAQFGHGSPNHFLQKETLRRLATKDKDDTFGEYRRQVFNMIRDPAYPRLELTSWPQVYGDTYGSVDPPLGAPRNFGTLTRTQYNSLKQWVAGNFLTDLPDTLNPSAPQGPDTIESVPLAEQPDMLDRAALYFCMGGPFHPGCELTWPMRHRVLYHAPFRIRPRAQEQPEPDYGEMLTPTVAAAETGPLQASGPGALSRWMALPWQTDTASCRSGYQREYDPFLPTFWPARVPNHVLSDKDYNEAVGDGDLEARRKAFQTRSVWLRGLEHEGQFVEQINRMVTDFGKLGVLERREPADRTDDVLPEVVYVETGTMYPTEEIPHQMNLLVSRVEKFGRPQRKIRRFQESARLIERQSTGREEAGG